MSKNKKEEKITAFGKNLMLLAKIGFNPIQQKGCWYHYKDGAWNFYPTTGKYYNDITQESGFISDLTPKKAQTFKS